MRDSMITSKNELKAYLLADKIALNRKRKKPRLNDYIWRYEILLRYCEYYNNVKNSGFSRIIGYYLKYKRSVLGAKLGFSIPVNTTGKGLCISHIGPIIINPYAKIGDNCRIHVGVNIGADARLGKACPIIGNNVYIGPGAKIFGQVIIADNIAIGANAVVNKSFNDCGISIGGIPAKKISDLGTSGILY